MVDIRSADALARALRATSAPASTSSNPLPTFASWNADTWLKQICKLLDHVDGIDTIQTFTYFECSCAIAQTCRAGNFLLYAVILVHLTRLRIFALDRAR